MPIEIIAIGILTLIASTVGTMTGFGTSTIMIPVLLFYYPLPQALLLVGIIHFVGDIWKMILFRKGATWNLLLLFGIPSVLAAYAGARLTLTTEPTLLLRILGAALITYMFFLLFHSSWKLPKSNATAVAGGALSGLMAGIFGVGGAVRGAFLTAFDFPKHVYIFTTGAIAFMTDSIRLLTYGIGNVNLPKELWYGMILFLPLSFAGAWFAKKTVGHVSEKTFRQIIALFLALVGIKFLLFP
ncbi:sulfite exporter TauE/SafE family protein [Candidatus Peregrinibacteria bacterium]|nr:sulfite exporter TauE/SafE family protein [Candidatus Peregrinibacteria bacterium]